LPPTGSLIWILDGACRNSRSGVVGIATEGGGLAPTGPRVERREGGEPDPSSWRLVT